MFVVDGQNFGKPKFAILQSDWLAAQSAGDELVHADRV